MHVLFETEIHIFFGWSIPGFVHPKDQILRCFFDELYHEISMVPWCVFIHLSIKKIATVPCFLKATLMAN